MHREERGPRSDPAPSAFLIFLEEGQVLNQLLWLERLTETKETRTKTKPPKPRESKIPQLHIETETWAITTEVNLETRCPGARLLPHPGWQSQSESTTQQRSRFLDIVQGSLNPPSAEMNCCVVTSFHSMTPVAALHSFLISGATVGMTGEGGSQGSLLFGEEEGGEPKRELTFR